MKKKSTVLLALLLSLTLLTGCGGLVEQISGLLLEPDRDIPTFPEMEYVRPDLDAIEADFAAVNEELEGRCSLRRTKELVRKCYDDLYSFHTMATIAMIRSNQNLQDSYYAEESLWCEANLYTVQQDIDKMLYACGASKLAKKLEDSLFWEGFAEEYSDESESIFTDRYVELRQQESDLLSEYYNVMSDPVIMLDGDEVHVYDYFEYAGGYDYFRVMTKFYQQYNSRYADIYLDLVAVRRALAEELGYDSYEQMQYEFEFERDYTVEEAHGYIAQIKEHIVPLYKLLKNAPHETEDAYPMDEEEVMAAVEAAVREMGGEIEEAFDFMVGHELYDAEYRAAKADMSYETYLYDYDAPFLFLDPDGNIKDVLSLAHEFGHYSDAYINYGGTQYVDVGECFSQGMEYLVLERLNRTLDQSTVDALTTMKLFEVLDIYIQQASFAEFESRIYSTPEEELTKDFINELAFDLAVEYGYYDGMSRAYFLYSWPMIVHFFEKPFYVVSYPLTNDVAMQIYMLEREESGQGLDKYLELLGDEAEHMIERVEDVGLEDPLSEGGVKRMAKMLAELLLNVDSAAA